MDQQHHVYTGTMLQICAASCTDTGRVRPHNEDALVLCEPPTEAQRLSSGFLYLLADGAGGHAAGEVASRIAATVIPAVYYDEKVLAQPSNVTMTARLTHLDILSQRLRQAFLAAHTQIQQAAQQEGYAGMATTCLVAVVKDASVVIAHVGDSRAYLVREGGGASPTALRLTKDHSMAAELLRAGVLTPEQGARSHARHLLLRALGGTSNQDGEPDITLCEVRAGDRLVLCCDGLWSMLSEEQLAAVVSSLSPEQACSELIRLANEAGGPDNISAIILAFQQTS